MGSIIKQKWREKSVYCRLILKEGRRKLINGKHYTKQKKSRENDEDEKKI